MAIGSSEFPYDMNAWVCEKSYKVLHSACSLVELFNRKNSMSPPEREEVEDALFYIVRNGAALLAFGYENTQAYSPEWVSLIAAQGRERLDEFSRVASGRVPADTKPAEFPESIQRLLHLFAQVLELLCDTDSSRTVTRMKLIELGEALEAIRGGTEAFLSKAGKRLLDLVDKQSFYANISWEELASAAKALVEESKAKYLEMAERYRWKPQA